VLVNSIVMKLDELEGEVLKLGPPTRARLAEVLLRSLFRIFFAAGAGTPVGGA